MSDLLMDAALVWQRLMAYEYHLTAARKKKAHTIHLCFSNIDFYHLAGFQYLKDISALPKASQAKYHGFILSGKVSLQQISRSVQYEPLVAPRLQAIAALESALDGDFEIFHFSPSRLSFYSQITGEYLIQGNALTQVQLVFVSRHETQGAACFCRSAFVMNPARDYRLNQPKMTLLHKAKLHIETGETRVIFQK